MTDNFTYKISHRSSDTSARRGQLTTPHGTINTPIFMPVGTAATVKTLSKTELEDEVDAEIILGNTYHLYLRPGLDVIGQGQGIHGFSDWKRPLLTDSGGYQVFSLSSTRKISEEGVTFTSHIDGSKHFLSPEVAIDIQRVLGADIIMVLDECTPYPCEKSYAAKSLRLTDRWMKRCFKHMQNTSSAYGYPQCLAPIVQGSTYEDLRVESAKMVTNQEAAIYAIGGLSVGEPEAEMYSMTEIVTEILPRQKPRYLMGVGTPWNLLECIARGVDMFDCVLPSRNARHGLLYTWQGKMNIKNAKWKNDHSPIDTSSRSHLSRQHTKAYLRHLIHSKEYLGARIATLHNLCFYLELVREAQKQIAQDTYGTWYKEVCRQMKEKL